MAELRKPFQGVLNIVRFNWHFYALSIMILLILWIGHNYLASPFLVFSTIVSICLTLTILISLITSYYVYDVSSLYDLKWVGSTEGKLTAININAGFDETSVLLKKKLNDARLLVYDF